MSDIFKMSDILHQYEHKHGTVTAYPWQALSCLSRPNHHAEGCKSIETFAACPMTTSCARFTRG